MEQSLINSVKIREPILDKKSIEQFQPNQMDQQWKLITEIIRRDVLVDSKTRQIAIEYIASPVSESLPNTFLSRLSDNNRIKKIIERYKNKISAYLKLIPVPEDQIIPDIKNADSLTKPDDVCGEAGTQEYFERLKHYIDKGVFLNGITAQERLMIAQRYRFARDIKLLSLQAEVLEQQEAIQSNNHNEIILPSGVIININIEDRKKRQDLINPQKWEKRKQIKDRVYEIQVGSSKYILKEKKTARHTDTWEGEHKPGLTSLEEFRVAKNMQENGVVEQGNIKVNWEKPIASVVFPDGFQFTVFEYQDDLTEEYYFRKILAHKIQEHSEQFKQEFYAIQTMAEKFKNDPDIIDPRHINTESRLKRFLEWTKLKKSPKLTFKEFSEIKATRMLDQAMKLMTETTIKNGYNDTDGHDSVYKINLKDGNLQLEIFRFDFEYFSKIDSDEIDLQLKNYEIRKRQWVNTYGFPVRSLDGSPSTRIQKAGYAAMLETEGLLQRNKEYY